MKTDIDYELDVMGSKLLPISTKQTPDFYKALYKYNEYYIVVSMSKSNDDSFSAIIYKNKQYFKEQIIDGANVITTNFLISYDILVEEIRMAILLIEKKIASFGVFGDVSVNQSKYAIFNNY